MLLLLRDIDPGDSQENVHLEMAPVAGILTKERKKNVVEGIRIFQNLFHETMKASQFNGPTSLYLPFFRRVPSLVSRRRIAGRRQEGCLFLSCPPPTPPWSLDTSRYHEHCNQI